MTSSATSPTTSSASRYRFRRAGVLNVWQYDRQVFHFADGRLLLRGTNGAGKSKTLELLLPYVLDGDKARMTASGRHSTTLLWLMLDGHEGGGRTGYVWVELGRPLEDGGEEVFTCGIGMRVTESARTATSWFFVTRRRIGEELSLEDGDGPLSLPRLRAALDDGHSRVFESPRPYREYVGRELFGLDPDGYDDLLRLVYWLRQPQVGEDIDPRRLAEQLVNALPALDRDAVDEAGETFDQLRHFGEELERGEKAATALGAFVALYAGYARHVLSGALEGAERASGLVRRATSALRLAESSVERTQAELTDLTGQAEATVVRTSEVRAAVGALESGPEARTRRRLVDLAEQVDRQEAAKRTAVVDAERASALAGRHRRHSTDLGAALGTDTETVLDALTEVARGMGDQGVTPPVLPSGARGLGSRLEADLEERTRSARSDAGPQEGDGWERVGPASDVAPDGGAAMADETAEVAPDQTVDRVSDWVRGRRTDVVSRQAAVQVVLGALEDWESARGSVGRAEESQAGAEQRLEAAARLSHDARTGLDREVAALAERVRGWLADPAAVPVELPELTPESAAVLDAAVADAVDPKVQARTTALTQARSAQADLVARAAGLRSERAAVAAVANPVPAAPSWDRADRDGRPGAPFWRTVDVRRDPADGETTDEGLALVEAALDGAGLLDAWVMPDGSVHLDTLDVVLGPDRPLPDDGASLARILRPDPTLDPACGVSGEQLGLLLRSVALVAAGEEPAMDDGQARLAVSADGRWWAGPLRGHTTKAHRQYVGASARESERHRRLAELDRQIAEVEREHVLAAEEVARCESSLATLRTWLRGKPRADALLRASTLVEERRRQQSVEEQRLDEAAETTARARARAETTHRVLLTAGEEHGLPVDGPGLQARRAFWRDTDARLARLLGDLERLPARLREWRFAADTAVAAVADAQERGTRLGQVRTRLEVLRAELDELRRAEGGSVETLERRLAELRREAGELETAASSIARRRDALTEQLGALRAQVESERAALDGTVQQARAAQERLSRLRRAPGLLTAAGVAAADADALDGEDPSVWRRLRTSLPSGASDVNAVLAGMRDLQSGPAAQYEPRLQQDDDLLVAVAHGETGDVDLPTLTGRLTDKVDQDRLLLTEREREQFERHLLGRLGDALREVRLRAGDLVDAMNRQLQQVTTSQGIRVRLRWTKLDALPAAAIRALDLLVQPLGALLPDERTELRDALHRLIELSAAEAPQDPYAEHLARALDYRAWFAFTVQYRRPGESAWRDLQRKSALSQGEQKVLCYLPLFAAAAAHFTSVAGVAPHAPRFVLLDDAFPKIDTRTHPLLFGLLVDLDLDFVVTSERLWGCHPQVPSLAIYEALRAPGERGIAQLEHRWDGRALTMVDA